MDTGKTLEEEEPGQIQVRFFTKLQPPLRIPTTSIAVPSNFTRMGLSNFVNRLLRSGIYDFEPQPFDFLIGGKLLRIPLERFLLANGMSAETVCEIEYIKALDPRRQQDPCSHDENVTSVDGSNPSLIVTGCDDSFARIWKDGALCTHTLEGHTERITSVNIINSIDAASSNNLCLATGSCDHTMRLWKFDVADVMDCPTKIRAFKILKGHTEAVTSISSEPSGNMICSGSWDNSIKLWQVEDKENADQMSIKKRKVDYNEAFCEESQLEAAATSTLVGHSSCVSSVVWPEHETLYSASWDHSIRRWDAQTGIATWIMVREEFPDHIDVGGESSARIVAGGSDSILRIWDLREPGTLAPAFQFSAHSKCITACKWHRRSWFHLLSASIDGKVMLWDLRAAWPLSVLDSHQDEVLCADWWKSDSVISGADSKLYVFSNVSIE